MSKELPIVGNALGGVNDIVASSAPDMGMWQCHPECFPGLGGETICLFDDMVCDQISDGTSEVPTPTEVPPPTDGMLSPSNTPDSSVGLAKENLCYELVAPHPHQVGSIPGGPKPPSPCSGFNKLGTKVMGGDLSPKEDLSYNSKQFSNVSTNMNWHNPPLDLQLAAQGTSSPF